MLSAIYCHRRRRALENGVDYPQNAFDNTPTEIHRHHRKHYPEMPRDLGLVVVLVGVRAVMIVILTALCVISEHGGASWA